MRSGSEQPLVSVIIPTFNRPDYLEKAITSVSGQSYSNFEILIVDDGSKEAYAKPICNNFEKCTYYFKPNGGLSSARNFGVKKAVGEYIAFLDDDDYWAPDKLEKQVGLLKTRYNIDCVHSAAYVVDEDNRPTGSIIGASKNKEHKRSGNVFWNALGLWVVKSPTPLIRKKVFEKGLWFDENIRVGEDVDFYQRMFYRHKIFYIPEPLAYYREYSNQKRLSTQAIKYIGLEKRMLANFRDMGVRNRIVLYRIAFRLLTMGIRNWKRVFPEVSLNFNTLDTYLRPMHCIDVLTKQKEKCA